MKRNRVRTRMKEGEGMTKTRGLADVVLKIVYLNVSLRTFDLLFYVLSTWSVFFFFRTSLSRLLLSDF